MSFVKTILYKEADRRLLCRFGSSMCNEKLKCDKCLKQDEKEKYKQKFINNLEYK